MAKPGKGSVGKAGGKAAGGIFAKHAGELFRVKGSDKVIRLDPTKIDDPTRRRWRKDRRSKTPDPGTKVNSRKIDPDDKANLDPKDRELVDAVDDAVRELGYTGQRNFAAIRYMDTDGVERILVTRSDGVHSERMGGNYLLDRMGHENIKAIYTERSPCNERSSYCDKWIKEHISQADVLHGSNYGIEGSTKAESNNEIRTRRRGLYS